MRILVTGGCGFIGANLVHHLLESTEHEVLNVDALTYAGNQASLADVSAAPGYRFSRTDIRDGNSIGELLGAYRPQAIMHLAAESHVDRSIESPAAFVQTNVLGTCTLLDACLGYWRTLDDSGRSGFRFLHISTDEVYGSLGPGDPPFAETTPYAPRSPYAASKAASDHFVRAWHHTYGLPTIITNCSNNFGPYQFPEKLIPTVILKCLAGQPVPVYGTGDNVRDWLYVEDHVEALVRVLHGGVPGETYNVGGGSERRNIDLVRSICSILDAERPRDDGALHESLIEFVQDRPGHDKRYAIDSGHLRAELGWAPRFDHDDALRATVRWYLENEAWWREILSGGYRMERLGLTEGRLL